MRTLVAVLIRGANTQFHKPSKKSPTPDESEDELLPEEEPELPPPEEELPPEEEEPDDPPPEPPDPPDDELPVADKNKEEVSDAKTPGPGVIADFPSGSIKITGLFFE
jgi:hypothetical protein